ncbi:GtrA family protein [Agromyces sp. PvR057]|uniref:GtrA family protein n=1 Tax=Agromyces sp. PvR057 TaxID=3156403 RepID=UPI000E37B0D6
MPSPSSETQPSAIKRFIDGAVHLVMNYALKFGVVGIIAYVVDVGIFNLIRLAMPDEVEWQWLMLARVIAFVASTVVAWIGNRYWTFREHRRTDVFAEFIEFLVVAIAGLAIVLLCLYVSHYVLGFDSLLADNISSNVIGFVLATAFRFLLYRYWVYGDNRKGAIQRDLA